MNSPQLKHRMTAQEFLAWELEQTERHDFVDGVIYNMSGGTMEHADGILSIGSALRTHLKGTPCKAFVSDMKVAVHETGNYFYPDVVVTCSAKDLANSKSQSIEEPTLIVEVLSPSTAAYDRGEKFANYRLLASLKEYVLADITGSRLDVFRRNAQGRWELFEQVGLQNPAEFESIGWRGKVGDVLPAPSPAVTEQVA